MRNNKGITYFVIINFDPELCPDFRKIINLYQISKNYNFIPYFQITILAIGQPCAAWPWTNIVVLRAYGLRQSCVADLCRIKSSASGIVYSTSAMTLLGFCLICSGEYITSSALLICQWMTWLGRLCGRLEVIGQWKACSLSLDIWLVVCCLHMLCFARHRQKMKIKSVILVLMRS